MRAGMHTHNKTQHTHSHRRMVHSKQLCSVGKRPLVVTGTLLLNTPHAMHSTPTPNPTLSFWRSASSLTVHSYAQQQLLSRQSWMTRHKFSVVVSRIGTLYENVVLDMAWLFCLINCMILLIKEVKDRLEEGVHWSGGERVGGCYVWSALWLPRWQKP